MERIILGALVVFGIVVARMVALPEDSVLGSAITVTAALTFMGLGFRYALKHASDVPPPVDCDDTD